MAKGATQTGGLSQPASTTPGVLARMRALGTEVLDAERRASNLRMLGFMAKAGYYSGYVLRDGTKQSPATLVEELAARTPDSRALWFEGRWRTFAELNEQANRVASVLVARGATAGDCLALMMDSRPDYLAVAVACNKLGMVVSLVNTFVRGEQLEHAMRVCSPKFILCGGEHVEPLAALDAIPSGKDAVLSPDHVLVWHEDGVEPTAQLEGSVDLGSRLADASPDNPDSTGTFDVSQPFCYIYTSGTTGLPKAVPMTNSRFLKGAHMFGNVLTGLGPSDVVYSGGLPFYHGSGMISSWGSSLVTGGACAMRRRFSASRFFEDCAASDATAFVYVGEYCRYLHATPPSQHDRAHKLRMIMGAGLRPDIWHEFVTRFAIPQVYEFYGATEANTGLFNLDNRPGMLGRRLPGQAIVAVDEESGEILRDDSGHCREVSVGEQGMFIGRIRGLNQFDGYLDSSKNDSKVLTDPLGDGDNYFNSGDLVMLHEGGWLSFRDRLGDTYRWKAENVSTNDVQDVLTGCPHVREANVYGVQVPHNDGRAGMVALVVEEGFDYAELARHVEENLPAYSRPVFVRIEEQLELTASFKYVKTRLKNEGFSPAQCGRPVHFLMGGQYVPLDGALLASIDSGTRRL